MICELGHTERALGCSTCRDVGVDALRTELNEANERAEKWEKIAMACGPEAVARIVDAVRPVAAQAKRRPIKMATTSAEVQSNIRAMIDAQKEATMTEPKTSKWMLVPYDGMCLLRDGQYIASVELSRDRYAVIEELIEQANRALVPQAKRQPDGCREHNHYLCSQCDEVIDDEAM